MRAPSSLFKWLVQHYFATYVLMSVSFLLFGAFSLHLAHYATANADYILENGWAGLVDGGFAQILHILSRILLAIAAYLVFKLCEHALIERVAHYDKAE